MLEGFDISGGTLRYAEAAAAKSFAFIKTTDGVRDVNRWLDAHATGLRGAGMRALGGYHFLRVRHGRAQDADEQARECAAARANAGVNVLPLLLDIELGEGPDKNGVVPAVSNRHATKAEVAEATNLFIDTWRAVSPDPLWGYSSPGEIGVMGLSFVPAFTALPLIVADYEAVEHVPHPFTAIGWQNRGNVLAFGGCIDLIRLDCTLEDLGL